MNKTKASIVTTLLCIAFLASVFYTTYSAIEISSNTVTVTPIAPPGLQLTVSNSTPYKGETVTFTATLDNEQEGVQVRFYRNSDQTTPLGTANTGIGGVATWTYQIDNPITVIAKCTIS